MSGDDYINHPLNNSLTKNARSFERNRRFFPNLQSKSYDLTYDVPQTRNKRTCSFGYGNKTSLHINSSSPPPNNYNIRSSFQFKNTKGFSFGYGRDQATFGAPMNIQKRSNTMPGPGQYHLPSTLARNSIYMGVKLDSFTFKRNSIDVPGPGLYSMKQTQVNSTGRYVLSNYMNPLSPSFRSKTINTEESTTKLRRLSNLGPGSYDSSDALNSTGKYASSKYQSSKVRTFGRSRRGQLVAKTKLSMPGPGTYSLFSEFGNEKKNINKTKFQIKIHK